MTTTGLGPPAPWVEDIVTRPCESRVKLVGLRRGPHALAAREPYGVWGGFTEAERLRLLATGWEDLSDRVRGLPS